MDGLRIPGLVTATFIWMIFSIFSSCVREDEVQITDALRTLAAQGRVIAHRFQGRRFDCGSLGGFVEATNYFYQRDHLGE